MTTYTRVWKINGKLVVACEAEDAIKLFKNYYADFNANVLIHTVELVVDDNDNDSAILLVEDEK